MTFKDRSSFPLRKSLVATTVIILCYLMVLILLYGIVNSTKFEYGSIVFGIWGGLLGLSLVAYWAYRIIHYIKDRRDENQGKRK